MHYTTRAFFWPKPFWFLGFRFLCQRDFGTEPIASLWDTKTLLPSQNDIFCCLTFCFLLVTMIEYLRTKRKWEICICGLWSWCVGFAPVWWVFFFLLFFFLYVLLSHRIYFKLIDVVLNLDPVWLADKWCGFLCPFPLQLWLALTHSLSSSPISFAFTVGICVKS